MNFLKFPKNFFWGGAMSPLQTESKGLIDRADTTWHNLYESQPEDFYEGIGPDKNGDHLMHYKNDLKLFKDVGMNSFRTGISWARLFPEKGKLNKDALTFYQNYIEEAKKQGLELFITLNHFEMPSWASELGGWENKIIIKEFLVFCKVVFDNFIEDIKYFLTFCEPNVNVVAGYLDTAFPPGIIDNLKAVQVGFNIILAHAKTVHLFKKYQPKNQAKIGVSINLSPAIPTDGSNFSAENEKAAFFYDLFFNRSVLDPMVKGEIPVTLITELKKLKLLPQYTQDELNVIKQTKIDFLGVNYYQPARVQKPQTQNNAVFLLNYYQKFHWAQARINVFRGWEIYPKGIYDIAIRLKNEYNNIPFLITENGMGVQDEAKYKNETGIIDDQYRIAFVSEHLEWLHKAIQEGANCFGYHMWATLDCWSWKNAYKNRYGFISVDTTTWKRTLKMSAYWFAHVSARNGISSQYKKLEETINLQKVNYKKSVTGL